MMHCIHQHSGCVRIVGAVHDDNGIFLDDLKTSFPYRICQAKADVLFPDMVSHALQCQRCIHRQRRISDLTGPCQADHQVFHTPVAKLLFL